MEVYTGVSIGVAGSFVFAVLAFLFKTSILPWYLGITYQGPNISGIWKTYDSNGGNSRAAGTATVTQKGNRAFVSVHRTRSRSGSDTNREFIYHGSFDSGQLTLLFNDKNSPGFVTGAIVLRLSSDSKELTGKTTYFDHGENQVVSHDFWLKRDA